MLGNRSSFYLIGINSYADKSVVPIGLLTSQKNHISGKFQYCRNTVSIKKRQLREAAARLEWKSFL